MNSNNSILVIDDESLLLSFLKELLEEEGFSVDACEDPLEALQKIGNCKYAIILSDYRLPNMTGLDLLCKAREIQPEAVRILMTAFGNLKTVIDAINRGEIFRFMAKPWTHEELMGTIRNAMEHFELKATNLRLQNETATLNAELISLNTQLEGMYNEVQLKVSALKTQLEQSLQLCYLIQERTHPVLAIHCKSRSEICENIIRHLDLGSEDAHTLRTSALLCDLGIIGISSEILEKYYSQPESLSAAENDVLRNHPIISQQLAALVDSSSAIGTCVRCHHEHYDGSGFPNGIAGENIPLIAHLLIVIVHYCESTLSQEATLQEIEKRSGEWFHPEAVRMFFCASQIVRPPAKVREVVFSQLQPGARLASGLYGPTGLLLVPGNRVLDAETIRKVHSYNRISPLKQRIFVYL